jgi:hypothetical protein
MHYLEIFFKLTLATSIILIAKQFVTYDCVHLFGLGSQIDEYDLIDPVDILSPLEKSGFWEGVVCFPDLCEDLGDYWRNYCFLLPFCLKIFVCKDNVATEIDIYLRAAFQPVADNMVSFIVFDSLF